jgi:hypothetical protein
MTVSFPRGAERRYNLYCWTIGHGGKTRSLAEYRIQTKLKSGTRLSFGDAISVLLGYFDSDLTTVPSTKSGNAQPGMVVIVAWDATRHVRVGASSSCQVAYDVLLRAHLAGAASATRRSSAGGSETVIGIRPEFLARYLLAMDKGHNALNADIIVNQAI